MLAARRLVRPICNYQHRNHYSRGTRRLHCARTNNLHYSILSFPSVPLLQSRRLSVIEVPKLTPAERLIRGGGGGNKDFRVEYPPRENLLPSFWQNDDLTEASDISQKPPVVILLGWYGSTQAKLSEYSQIYQERGCITVSYTPRMPYGIFQIRKAPIIAEALVKKLRELDLVEHPTFIHAFSNNGSFLHSSLLREFARSSDKTPVNLKGSICDSGPNTKIFWPFCKASPTLLSHLGPWRYPAAIAISLALAVTILWWYVKYALLLLIKGAPVPEPLSTSKPHHERILLHSWLCRIVGIRNHPFAFIYSTGDNFLSTSTVENIAAAVKKRGNPTTMILFSASKHVEHYQTHPEEYVTGIQNFIKNAMRSNCGPPEYWDELD